MHGWFWGYGVAGCDIKFGGFGHAVAEVGDFFVGHAIEVLFVLSVELGRWLEDGEDVQSRLPCGVASSGF